MKVLTIKQPWATLIMQGNKRFEFRSWQTKYRGELLIHAGKGIDKEAMKRLANYIPKDMPTGKILGKVILVDCVKMSPKLKKMLLKERGFTLDDLNLNLYNLPYYDNACEVCRGKTSSHRFCHKMYSRSEFERKYGAYAKKKFFEYKLF